MANATLAKDGAKRRVNAIAGLLEDMEADGVERDVPLDDIIVPERQVRRKRDPVKLADLTESVRAHKGNFHRVMLRKLDDGGLRMVFGFGRLLACRGAGLPTIRARIKVMTDWEEKALQRHENRQREDVDPFDEAQQVKEDLDEFGTPAKVAELWGTDVSWVSKRLALVEPSQEAQELAAAGVSDVDTLSGVSRLSAKVPELAKAVVAAVRSAPPDANKREIARATIKKGKAAKRAENGPKALAAVATAGTPAARAGTRPVPPIEQLYAAFMDGKKPSPSTAVGLLAPDARRDVETLLRQHYDYGAGLKKGQLAKTIVSGLAEGVYSQDGLGALPMAACLMGHEGSKFSVADVLKQLEVLR